VARVAKKLLRPKKAYLTAISPHARVSQFAQYLDF